MKQPLQITFRNMESSEEMEANICDMAENLDRFYDQTMSCRAVVEAHHRHHGQSNPYHVHIEVTVPGARLVASREPDLHHEHEDASVAIRDAFDAIRRQLKDYARRQRGDIKAHAIPPNGRISELHPEEDYGRINTSDGRDIYFHRNNFVEGDFDDLEIGSEVRFSDEEGESGPQASTVHLVGKHHFVA